MSIEQVPLLLELSCWGASDVGHSYTNFFVYEDGRFKKEQGNNKIAGVIQEGDEKVAVSESHTMTYLGRLNDEKLQALKEFLDENVKEDKSSMMFDAGYTIRYHKGEKEIVINNDMGLYNQITKLIPYDVRMEKKS